MRPELYTKVAEKYSQKFESFGEHNWGSYFLDSLNSVFGLEFIARRINSNDIIDKKEERKNFLFEVRIIRDYFK